jgi:hypothetical protein
MDPIYRERPGVSRSIAFPLIVDNNYMVRISLLQSGRHNNYKIVGKGWQKEVNWL